MKVAVVLPCYNEGATIAATIASFRAALPEAEIWVCDNASTDDTAVVARDAGARVLRERARGKGSALRRLFADVEADVYVMCDGDSTYDTRAAPGMIELLVIENLDMVVANRLHLSRQSVFRPGHHFGNHLFSGIVKTFFGSAVNDLLSGYRVLSRRFVKSFPSESRGFEIETELTVFALETRCSIGEVDTEHYKRPKGSASKLSTIRDGLRILHMVLSLLRDVRPLEFFGSISLLSAIVGVGMFYPLLTTFLETHAVPRFPTLIVLTGVLVLSVVFFTCGVILDRLAAVRRIQYRLRYLALSGPLYVSGAGQLPEARFAVERSLLERGISVDAGRLESASDRPPASGS